MHSVSLHFFCVRTCLDTIDIFSDLFEKFLVGKGSVLACLGRIGPEVVELNAGRYDGIHFLGLVIQFLKSLIPFARFGSLILIVVSLR